MLKRIALGMVLLAGLLGGTAWADESLDKELIHETSISLAYTNKDTAKTKVEELIAKGANVNAKDDTGLTPLHFAKMKDVAELLIAKGADVNAKDIYGNTPLHHHAGGDKDVAELLIAKGANVNAKDRNGSTPLHDAATETKNKDVIELLIAKGADVNAKDESGNTPLHTAANRINEDAVELLIMNGADANARNNKGLTPLQVLENRDVSDLLCFLHDAWVTERGCVITKPRIVAMLQTAQVKRLQKQAGNSHGGIQKLLTEFRSHSDDEVLRTSIIDLALKLKPAPAVPPEAEAAAGRAQYIFKNAKSDDDTLSAAKEYLKVVELAPWVANYYYNLCTVLEKTPYTQQALHACKLYLTAAPNAADAADMQQRIAGLQYAVDKNKEQMKQRTHGTSGGESELYRMGGLSGQVSGKDIGLKLTVDWQAAPPKYQVMGECNEGGTNGIWIQVRDLVSADTWVSLCSVNMHLVIKPDGAGFVELGNASTGSIRTTLDELFKLRRKALEGSEIISRGDKTYVTILQGGKNMQYTGNAMYESDCTGNPLRQDARALPDDFVTLEMINSGKNPYNSYDKTLCTSQFTSKTGYSFGGME